MNKGIQKRFPSDPGTLVVPHGGYAALKAYHKSEAVYLGTVMFCRRFLPAYGDRTVDQMTQAARSCKQNLAEGSATSGTSKETELRLTSVARASLDELLADYLDHLHAHGWEEWTFGNPRKERLRAWCHARNSWAEYRGTLARCPPEEFCNVLICLIHQTRALIDGMIQKQDRDLREHGDFRDRLKSSRQNRAEAHWDDGLFHWLSGSPTPETLAQREAEANRQVASIAARTRRKKGWA